MPSEYDLVVVMPVYNEQDCIAGVVDAWLNRLGAMGIKFRMIVINDGSKDDTARALAAYADDPRVEVVNKPNSGHGPTIIVGYRKAVTIADWVFQCDSDDEMKAEHFPRLWDVREQYDALFGIRQNREQNTVRALISAGSRITTRVLFAKGVADVNTPYRLIRSAQLRRIVAQIPDDTFAPNVIISGSVARFGLRICNIPVPHDNRRTGSVSIVRWRLIVAVWKAFWQTLRCRPRLDYADD